MFTSFFHALNTPITHQMLHAGIIAAPVWIPLLFLITWYETWIRYRRHQYIKDQGAVLLEVKIPREMFKSPLAMELFLNGIHQVGVGTVWDVYWKGRVRPWFSLELVSIDGQVHFFIWTQAKWKGVIETQLYGQFPNVEVHEVPDYALGIHRDPEHFSIGWIGQFATTKNSAYPLRTYIDYSLDKDQKEEYKNDPIVPTLEFLGSLRKGEQAWIQILIQAHTKEGIRYGKIYEVPDWRKGVEKEIKEILKKGRFKPDDDKTVDSTKHLSQRQKELIEAMERTANKNAFDTMIRVAYMAEKSAFNPNNIGSIIGCFKQFGSQDGNGFYPKFNSGYDYPWQDFRGKGKAEKEEKLLEAYKRRSFFQPPFRHFHGEPYVLSTEELASLWHFPSNIAAGTPTLNRIPSKKAEAPSNLPM